MEYLQEYLRTIIIFTVISEILNSLIREAKTQKYLKIFTGAIMTLLLISPVLAWKDIDIWDEIAADVNQSVSGEDMESTCRQIYENKITAIIESYGGTVVKIKCDTDGRKLLSVDACVENEMMGNEWKELIMQNYQLEESDIHISY